MIATAIGKPKPNALSVARANSESRFARGRTSGNDIALLLGAPAGCCAVMVNKGLTRARACCRNEFLSGS